MPINFSVIAKGQPGVVGGGQKKFYAQIEYGKELTMDELVKIIEKFSALSEPDIRGVIIAMENAMQDGLAAGRIVRLERLGTFYPAISSNGEEKEEDVNASSIRDTGVNYRPGDRIKKAIKDAGFEKSKK
jgi:DNA-binding protein, histone-like, putative